MMGEAASAAAVLALRAKSTVQDVPYRDLAARLHAHRAVLHAAEA